MGMYSGVGGAATSLLFEVQSASRHQAETADSTDQGSVPPVIYPLCRFPLKREESGSLIKGAWREHPVIIGARNLNFKRSVQLHFEKCREAPRKYRPWARMWPNQIWEVWVLAEFPLQIHIYSFYFSFSTFFLLMGKLKLWINFFFG